MGKHVVPINQQPYVTQERFRCVVAHCLRELAVGRPNVTEEANDTAVEIAALVGMAPPDLSEKEEGEYAWPHDESATFALSVLTILAPDFAGYLCNQLEVAYGEPINS